MEKIVITDASVLINLTASGEADEILSMIGLEFVVCPDVVREVKILRDGETGDTVPIVLESHFASGRLTLIEPDCDEEFELLIDYSAALGDGAGEAMCFALAEHRKLRVAIDDERAVRRAERRYPHFQTIGTLEILVIWQSEKSISDSRIGIALRSIERFARFRPSVQHPLSEWWSRCRDLIP